MIWFLVSEGSVYSGLVYRAWIEHHGSESMQQRRTSGSWSCDKQEEEREKSGEDEEVTARDKLVPRAHSSYLLPSARCSLFL